MRLSDRDILKALDSGELSITPTPPAVTGISVDLRLSHRFRAFRAHSVPYLNLSDEATVSRATDDLMSTEIEIDPKKKLFLHPGELVLGLTMESVQLPNHLVAWLEGRSSLARLGLMVHVTAGRIDPGWQGQIVLELYNQGKLPLALEPGIAICALSFELLSSPVNSPYSKKMHAKYFNQSEPIGSRLVQEPE